MLAAAWVVWPASAGAVSSSPGAANLSLRLAELAKPATRSASHSQQAARLGVAAAGPGSLLRTGNRVLVNVRFDSAAGYSSEALREVGASVVQASPRYQAATVAVRPADLAALGRLPGVGGVTPVLAPIVRGANCGGSVVSEGDAQLHADNARAEFGVDGSGVTVGILSDSFDRDPGAATHAAGDVASGDLPGPGSPCGSSSAVGVLDDSEAEGEDEGRAMAQIVHDLAPGAAIDFATAFSGELAFAANIKALAAAGAGVIADDVSYFEEPFFQDGPVAVAVDEVAAAGVSYFSAAGNDNLVDAGGHDIASWEAPEFRDSGGCPAALEAIPKLNAQHCMDFDPGPGSDPTFGLTVADGATLTVDLQWAEPWNGVATDLDAFLLDSKGHQIKVKEGSEEFAVESSEDNIGVSQRPVEVLQWENETGSSQKVQLAINRFAGASPRLKFALMENGSGVTQTEYPQSSLGDTVGPTIYGHAGATGAIAVAAVPFDNAAAAEPYSSRGPVSHYFGPVKGKAPAGALVQTIPKPDVAATDCGATTFFAELEAGIWRFCGTSAATPHAAAIAALVRQANPAAPAAAVRADLSATAHPVGSFGADAVGAGLLDAYGAVNALALPPSVAITQSPLPLSRNRRPTIQFTANRPVSFSCAVDGGAALPCSSPYTLPTALSDGTHGVAVTGVDRGGRSATSNVAHFTVDTRPPSTVIAEHPPKLVRSRHRKVREGFRFRSDEAGVTFVCKVDRDLPRFCRPRISRRFEAGRHTISVRAEDAAGNVDHSPAVFHFRVKQVG
jgi:hypothetical protein